MSASLGNLYKVYVHHDYVAIGARPNALTVTTRRFLDERLEETERLSEQPHLICKSLYLNTTLQS